MSSIKTVKELKEFIEDLPDDMPLKGYPDRKTYPMFFTLTKDDLPEEELEDAIADGFVPVLMIDTED